MIPSASSAIADAPAEVDRIAEPRDRRRRIITWTIIAAVLIIVGIAGSFLAGIGRWNQRDVLDPDSAGANGTRALAEILRQNGVEVVVVRDRAAAEKALSDDPATLVLPDAPYLSDDALGSIADSATAVVLIDPRSRTLDLLMDGSDARGFAGGETVAPACDLSGPSRAGRIAPGALFAPGAGIRSCYPVGDGWGLLASDRVTAVDGRELFTNEHLAENGNAALAVNLLGVGSRVVWYMPAVSDSDLPAGDPTLGELTPPWVSPVIVLLLVSGLAAAFWRGRRFGPLVRERLPVTVRTSETTEGRARLYAHAGDALHAADRLRIGTLGRLSRLLGLGPSASADEIADAAASRAHADRSAVRGLLLHENPDSDAELVALAARLRALENAVHAAVRPERNHR